MNYSNSKQIKAICPNSVVQEVHLPSYELELDFSNNEIEQERFFNRHERDFKADEVVTCLFKDSTLKEANMLTIIPKHNQIVYQLSLTFWHYCWQDNKPLHNFVLNLLRTSSSKGLSLQLEAEDTQGYYLLMTLTVPAEQTIQQRLNSMNSQLIDIIENLK